MAKGVSVADSMKAVLVKRREALLNTLRDDLDRFASRGDYSVGDSADGAAENEYQSVSARLSHSESVELQMINEALDRIRAGEYGVCEDCGCEISIERLRAIPFAVTCVNCQRLADSAGRMGGRR